MRFYKQKADCFLKGSSLWIVDIRKSSKSFMVVSLYASGCPTAYRTLDRATVAFTKPFEIVKTCFHKSKWRWAKRDSTCGSYLRCSTLYRIADNSMTKKISITAAKVPFTYFMSRRNSTDCFDNNTFARGEFWIKDESRRGSCARFSHQFPEFESSLVEGSSVSTSNLRAQ